MEAIEKKYGITKPLRLSYFQLGRSLIEQQQIEQAASAFLIASKYKGPAPLDWELKYYLGQCHENQSKIDEAVKFYIEGAMNTPEHFSFFFDLINGIITNETNAKRVLVWINDFISPMISEHNLTEVQAMEVRLFLGKLYLYNGNFDDAQKQFSSINYSLPKNLVVRAFEGIGEVYFRQNQFILAKQKLMEGISLVDNDKLTPEIQVLYIKVLLSTEDYEEARKKLEILKQFSRLNGTRLSPEIKISIAQCFLQFGLVKDAFVFIEQVSSTDLNEIGYATKIECYIAIHKYREGLKELEIGIRTYPLSLDLYFLKIQLYLEGQLNIREGEELFLRGYLPTATKESILTRLSAISKRRPDDGNAQCFIGFIYFLLGEDITLVKDQISKARQNGLKLGEGEKQDNYADIGLFILEAHVKENEKRIEEAALNFYEAGRRYYWQAEYSVAAYYLEKANQLNPNHRTAAWYWADSLRIDSRLDLPPYNDEIKINHAYEILERQPDNVVRSSDEAWSYIVASRIHEIRYNFATEKILDEYWKAVLYGERALIHSKKNYLFWSDVGKYYSNTGLYQTALSSLEKAIKLKEKDVYTLENKTTVLIDSGKLDEGEQSIEELKKINGHEYLSWKGFIQYKKGDYRPALDTIEKQLKRSEADVWSLGIKMLCYWNLYSFDKAQEVAMNILALRSLDIKRQESTFSWAEFVLGRTTEAITILEDYCRLTGDPYYESSNLCQFYLYANKIEEATAQFNNYHKRKIRWEAIKQLYNELEVIEKLPAKVEHHDTLIKTVTEWKDRLKARMKEMDAVVFSPEQELVADLDQGNYEKGSYPWIAIHAAQARLKWDNKEYFGAYQQYKDLTVFSKDFPDADSALQKVFNDVIEENKGRIRILEFNSVINELKASPIKGAEITALLIMAYLGQGKRKEAEIQLIDYLKEASNSNDREIAHSLSQTLLDSIPNDELFWGLGDLVESCKNKVENKVGNKDSLTFIESIENSLGAYWIARLGAGQTADLLPAVTPIAIEVSGDLIEDGPESEWPLLKKIIPDLRDDFKQRYDVNVPGLRIRGNETDLPDGTYIIMIDEIPIVSGNVRKNDLFVPGQSKELSELNLPSVEVEDPLSGAWVDRKYQPLLKEKNLVWWDDPFMYITSHLGTILIRRLDFLFDVQYTHNYLQDLGESDLSVKRIALDIRRDDKLLILFDKVLRGLLKEQVPVNNKDGIIRNFDTINTGTQPDQLIEKIRLELKQILPGNQPNLKRIILPHSVEQQIQGELKRDNGKTFLAMEPETCQEALSEIRDLVADHPLKGIVLEVESTSLRPYVRELIKLEFADLMVIAKEEVIEE